MGSCLEGKIGINEGFYYEFCFVFFFLRNRVYLYLMGKRTVIVVKEVKMIRELKYLKKLEGYPEHDVFHGEDTYMETLQLKVVPSVR